MSAVIAPCPFCGASAVIENDYGREYWAQCTDLECGATDGTLSKSPIDAANYWNRRPAPVQGALPDALPELPKPFGEIDTYHADASVTSQDGYTADQMQAHAGARAEYETKELSDEIGRLQKALCFWLPSVTDLEDEVALRILDDAFLLVGCDGNMPDDFKSAQELGWVALRAQQYTVSDAARLNFMASHSAWIAWTREGDLCRVFERDECGDSRPWTGWDKYYGSAREAIDAAIQAQAGDATGGTL